MSAMAVGDIVVYTLNGSSRNCYVLKSHHVPLGLFDMETGIRHDATRYKLRDIESGEEFWSTLLRDN
jgi:hypothetical protein